MAYKVFENGYPLPASDLNNYLMNQAVMVFASSTDRASSLTAPVEGMLTWLQDTNKYQYYTGSAWADLILTYTANRAIASNGSGELTASSVTATELGYLSGVTSAIQTQLNAKQNNGSIVDKSSNYSIVAGDVGNTIRSTSAPITITVDNVLTAGQRIDFIQDAGQITFVAGAGVTLQSKNAKLKTSAQYAGATIICVASGQYRLIGDLG